jgi:hypothetical protein
MKTLRIVQSTDSDSPRDWDNLGTIAYKHRNYILGEETISDPVDWLCEKLDISEESLDRLAAKKNIPVYSNAMRQELESRFFKKYIALSVFLYDHSGITISCSPFSCPWDSGQVGYIYVTKDKVKQEYKTKIISKHLRKRILTYLEGEIETFDQYLRGDVYGFIIEENEEHVDSCWGFYGTDWDKNGIKDSIPEECWHQLETVEIEY